MSKAIRINPILNTPILTFDRETLLFELSDTLKKYDHVALIGQAGSGKTTLVNQYLRHESATRYKNVFYFYGYELELDGRKLKLLEEAIIAKGENLIVIDEFDTIQFTNAAEQVSLRLKGLKKSKAKIIIVARSFQVGFEVDIFPRIINLTGRQLSKQDIEKLVKSYFPNQSLSKVKNDALISVLEELGTSPLAVRMALELLQKGDYTPAQLKSILHKQINYRNDLIHGSSIGNQIILTEPAKIITDLIFVNQSILDKVRTNPKSIYEITSRQFEELVAELFEKQGYTVTLTQQTQDGGKDLLIVENRMLGNFLCYVECKKYAPDNPVGVKIVRELFGTITADRATAGVVVTSSYFSNPAYAFTEKVKHQMNLIDYVGLNEIINTVTKKNNSR